MEELDLLRAIADGVDEVLEETPTREFGRDDGIGADGRPTAKVDRLAEERVLEILEASSISWNVCSEEAGYVDHGAERTLVVDPIDGTTNAVQGIPFYCVSLAVTSGGLDEVDLALVRNLPTGDTYEAVRGEGARRNGEPISTRAFEAGYAVRSPVVDADALEGLRDVMEDAPYVRGLGAAALEMALVAEGAMDLFLHLRGGLRVVDVAASQLLVRESGGGVVTPDGTPPDLPLDPKGRTSLIASGDRDVLSRLGVVA